MNHYGKLATLFVRIVALAVAVAAVLGFIGGIFSMPAMQSMMGAEFGGRGVSGRILFVPAIVNLLLAGILWAVSLPVGRLLGRDLG